MDVINRSENDRIKRFDKAWKRACHSSGISVRLFRNLRRTAVRNMIRSGAPERMAMMISSHKTSRFLIDTTLSTIMI